LAVKSRPDWHKNSPIKTGKCIVPETSPDHPTAELVQCQYACTLLPGVTGNFNPCLD
jgi:hypothetical protein